MPVTHTVFILDDDILILNTLKKRFSTWEIDLHTAATAKEALEILKTLTPEIIVMDLLLTSEQGSQLVVDFVKSQPRLDSVPILVLTNLDKPDLKAKLLSEGVKEYLIKGSLSLDEIYEKVVRYLEPSA